MTSTTEHSGQTIALVTGANRGLGKRFAAELVARGAKVYAAARRPETIDIPGVIPVQLDITDAESVRLAAETASDVNVLINNAGVSTRAQLLTGDLADIRLEMDTHYFGTLSVTRAFTPALAANGGGALLNVLSVLSWINRPGYAAYSAAKAAVIHLSKCVAMQLGEHNVRVNSISPGGIATGIFGKALGLSIEKAEQTAEAIKAGLAGLQPIPRAGITDDIANAAVFLASDESTFVNGHDLVVDGGVVGGRLWTPQQQQLNMMRNAFGIET